MAKPGEKFFIDARGVKASGIVTENGFIVVAGSAVRPTIAKYLNPTLIALRKQCEEDGMNTSETISIQTQTTFAI